MNEKLSAWQPLRIPRFRSLWLAQLGSNVGTWMQNVGAVWLMITLTSSPALVALVQTAAALPVFLLGLPGGALADILDRRRLLMATQAWMFACAAALGVLTVVDVTTPAILLGLTFGLGAGVALSMPAWQAIQPELVPRPQFPQAVALGGVAINLGRAIGPAAGGAVIAAGGPEWAFLLNAAGFLGVTFAVLRWRRKAEPSTLPAERLLGAMRAGIRYARYAPSLRAVLARAALFIVPASALTALLPVVAADELELGARGYGVLQGAFGFGAIVAASALPRLRRRAALDVLVALASAVFAAVSLAVGYVDDAVAVGAVLVVGGLAWLLVLSSLNVSAQGSVPNWVRGRGLALYVLLFMGGTAAGSALWGAIAETVSTSVALAAAAGLLAAGIVLTPRFRLAISERLDLRTSLHWPEPAAIAAPGGVAGPVLVTIEYRVAPERAADFAEVMRAVERMRRRTGARGWGLYRDAAGSDSFLETFVVESWQEHLRQHERVTESDRRLEERRDAFVAAGTKPVVRHLLWAYGSGAEAGDEEP